MVGQQMSKVRLLRQHFGGRLTLTKLTSAPAGAVLAGIDMFENRQELLTKRFESGGLSHRSPSPEHARRCITAGTRTTPRMRRLSCTCWGLVLYSITSTCSPRASMTSENSRRLTRRSSRLKIADLEQFSIRRRHIRSVRSSFGILRV